MSSVCTIASLRAASNSRESDPSSRRPGRVATRQMCLELAPRRLLVGEPVEPTHRIAIEAVNNVARHSTAAHCMVRLTVDPRLVPNIDDGG